MPAATEITRVLRTPEHWPVWVSRVNARLLAIGCRGYLSIDSSGGLELTAAGGPLDRRARVSGEDGIFERPRDREFLQCVKSKNEYLGFMLAVGKLLAGLRTHLGLGGGSRALVPQAKTKGSWISLLRQGLGSKSVQEGGGRLTGMYRSVRGYGINGLRDWRPHVDFVVSVNGFYSTMSGTIYLCLDRMQQEEKEPRADSFERVGEVV